jgi:hypothetical protein
VIGSPVLHEGGDKEADFHPGRLRYSSNKVVIAPERGAISGSFLGTLVGSGKLLRSRPK